MKKKSKVTGTARGIPSGLGLATLISMIVTFAGAAAVSHLISTGKLSEDAIGYAVMVILAVSAAMGAWSAISLIKRLRLQVCLMAGGCYYLILLATTALFFGGQYQGMLIHAIIIAVVCVLIAIIPGKNGSTWKKKKAIWLK